MNFAITSLRCMRQHSRANDVIINPDFVRYDVGRTNRVGSTCSMFQNGTAYLRCNMLYAPDNESEFRDYLVRTRVSHPLLSRNVMLYAMRQKKAPAL
jgi:hypothetical protein